jgi:hypothetical protein
MNKKLLKFSLVLASGVVVFIANPKRAYAYEEPIAGFTYDKLDQIDQATEGDDSIKNMSTPIPGFKDVAIANVDTNLMIRKEPKEDASIAGKLPKNGGCTILEEDDGSGWTYIKSGKVKGYCKTEFLITGEEASKKALEVGNLIATANNDSNINVRKDPSVDSEVIDQIAVGEEILVKDDVVVSYGEDYDKWVKVVLDSDESVEGTIGYVAKDYVDLSYKLKEAFTLEEEQFGSGVSSTRISIVNLAKEYLGYAYVWGGTSLGDGVDCSGFTQALYARFGYYIPRVSRAQASSGNSISSSELKPGDLVFYGSSGYINHVAMYIGNGRVIHASNPRDGIKISNMYYRSPVKFVRYLD